MYLPYYRSFLLVVFIFFYNFSSSQPFQYGLKNGLENKLCADCIQKIADKPDDVLFGIDIDTSGNVFFIMNNTEWFEKIFSSPAYGISVDIISKDRYDCNRPLVNTNGMMRGQILKPVYKPELLNNEEGHVPGNMYVQIGTIPANLKGKELEGNLIIVKGDMICYYSNFVNIDRSVWDLLPMGLFTDTLVQISKVDANSNDAGFTYSRKVQFTIPFEKNKTVFSQQDIKPLYDSLNLKNYSIQKIELRAYSSVEGPEKINIQLMNGRANSLLEVLKRYRLSMQRINIVTAENWLEFFDDIEYTKFNDLKGLSKDTIKQRILDKKKGEEIEPLLSKHRKAVVTLYLETAYGKHKPVDSIVNSFNAAVKQKNIKTAIINQKELFNEIRDNKVPVAYLDRLEIPVEKEYLEILNDKETYKYLLKTTSEYEALQNLRELKKLDPSNGKINYNICALRFFIWQYGNDSTASHYLLDDINALGKQGINQSLVRRMLVNYHIMKCYEYNNAYRYDDKDSALHFIKNEYRQLQLNDEEMYSLAKYFTNYAQGDWAEEMIEPRINKLDVSEDLVFYYINLLFFHYADYEKDTFRKAVLNAINLNRKRYCNFFLPNDKGGASMQLLEFEILKSIYCESCKR